MRKTYTDLSPERVRVSTEKSPRYHFNHHCNNKNRSNSSSHPEHQRKQQCSNNKVSVVYYLCKNQQLEHPHFMEVTLSSPDGLHLRDVIERLNALRGKGMASMYSWSCKRIYKNGYVWHDLCEDDLIVPARANEYVLKGSEIFEDCKVSNNSTEFKIHKSDDLANASTQTKGEAKSSSGTVQTHIKGISTEDGSSKDVRSKTCQNESRPETISPPTSTSSDDSSSNTLESLIKADLKKQKNLTALDKHDLPSHARITASNMILQLISCGSLSVNDGNCGLIDKSRFLKIPPSLMLGENPRVTGCKKCNPIALKDPQCKAMRSQFPEEPRISSDDGSLQSSRITTPGLEHRMESRISS